MKNDKKNSNQSTSSHGPNKQNRYIVELNNIKLFAASLIVISISL